MRITGAATATTLALLAGCNGHSDSGAARVGASASSSQASVNLPDDTPLDCQGFKFTLATLRSPRPATQLRPGPKQALRDRIENLKSLKDWAVISEEQDSAAVVQQIPQQFPDEEIQYDVYELSHYLRKDGLRHWKAHPLTCTMHREFPGLVGVGWFLDAEPQPGDRTVQILLYPDCNTSTDPVSTPVLEMAPDVVRVAFAAKPVTGNPPLCDKNPARKYVLELPERLGDRKIVDANDYPEHQKRLH